MLFKTLLKASNTAPIAYIARPMAPWHRSHRKRSQSPSPFGQSWAQSQKSNSPHSLVVNAPKLRFLHSFACCEA